MFYMTAEELPCNKIAQQNNAFSYNNGEKTYNASIKLAHVLTLRIFGGWLHFKFISGFIFRCLMGIAVVGVTVVAKLVVKSGKSTHENQVFSVVSANGCMKKGRKKTCM